MLLSLIYVSRSLLELPSQAGEVDRIVTGSTERNAALKVRGALIFTEQHFAQILEGPEPAVDELMVSIDRDWRHERVLVIERKPISDYNFPDWSLAYWGSASYMDQHVARVVNKADELNATGGTSNLYALMQLLARESRRLQAPIGRPSPGTTH